MLSNNRQVVAFARLIVIVFLVSATRAQAQFPFPPQRLRVISCVLTGIGSVNRAESHSDIIGKIFLDCINSGVPTPGPFETRTPVNIGVFLTVGVTNRIDFSSGPTFTDAVLVVHGNEPATPTTLSTLGGPNPELPVPQLGELSGLSFLAWNGVQFPVPGAPLDEMSPPAMCMSASDCFQPLITIEIKNIRADTAALGTPLAPGVSPGDVEAVVAATSPGSFVITNNIVTVSTPVRGISSSTSLGVGPGDFNIDLSEGFATAWKPFGTASLLFLGLEEESGYPVLGSGPTGAGASQGTRILVDFVDESPPSSISVPNEVSDGAGLLLKRVAGADAMGVGGAIVGGAGMHIVDTSSGSGRVIYEVDQIGPFVLETVSIPANVIPSVPADIRVSAMLGPTSTINVAHPTAPIPRFVEILLPVSVVADGLISDGTVNDDDSAAQVIFPPGSPGGASEVIIDQTNDPLATPPPAGFSSVGTGFFNIELVPPAGPFCPIGITLVLPVNPPLPAATMLPLLRVNETTGVLETVPDCSGSSLVVGVVDPPGTTATFMGIPSLSLFVGLLPEGPTAGAAGLISQVDDLVESGDLRKGLDAPLTAFLRKALRAIDRGQDGLAAFFLQKFQGRVQWLVDRGELSAGAGQALIDEAAAVIQNL